MSNIYPISRPVHTYTHMHKHTQDGKMILFSREWNTLSETNAALFKLL